MRDKLYGIILFCRLKHNARKENILRPFLWDYVDALSYTVQCEIVRLTSQYGYGFGYGLQRQEDWFLPPGLRRQN